MDKDHTKQSEKEQIKWKACKLANKNYLCRNQYQCTSGGMFQNNEVLLKTEWKYEHSWVSQIEWIFWKI